MEPPFAEYDADEKAGAGATNTGSGRLRDISVRLLVPNLITLGAICCGLTGIRLAIENRFELAVIAILFAAILDGVDGRVARLLKASTSFGEQMDSLADFVNFGVAPAMVLYLWNLSELRSFGWIIALIFAVCGCLRLARFNVMLEDENRPKWQANFFTGVPAPAGAMLGLLPIYLGLLGFDGNSDWMKVLSAIYVLTIAYLMVSNIPTWSGKTMSARVQRRWAVPLLLTIVFLLIFLFSYPWLFLTIICIGYLATIPFSVSTFKALEQQDEEAAAK